MPLTESQRRHLERRLREERALVVRSLGRYNEEEGSGTERDRAGDISAAPFHLADEGTDTYDREFSGSLAARDTTRLHEIDDALRRLIDTPDRFGLDERTGEEIPLARLEIIPWARANASGDEGDRAGDERRL
jgi:RNA polymerase-binding transcription factor DksA